jgi:hypothetical protein
MATLCSKYGLEIIEIECDTRLSDLPVEPLSRQAKKKMRSETSTGRISNGDGRRDWLTPPGESWLIDEDGCK